MDGFKKLLNASLQFKLSVTLSLAILVAAIVAGAFSFLSAFDEAHELQDDVLRQVAQLVDRQQLPSSSRPAEAGPSAITNDRDEESHVIVQHLGIPSTPSVAVDQGGPLPLPPTLADGLQTLNIGGEQFRVLVRTVADGERFAVAQEAAFRDEIARDSALRTVTPLLVLVPILLLIVAHLVRTMFRPIATLSQEIDQRSEQDLHTIESHHLPAEVRPFAVAINRLLTRVARAMNQQRRFVADAAHELRSPLTALSLQAERLAETEMSAPARERLAALRLGIERGRNLLDQLLAMARAQSATEPPKAPASVQGVYRRVLEDLMPLAEAKHIDIGVEGAQDVQLWISELDLIAVVKNLVENAVRYTPEGGRVDLAIHVTDCSTELHVLDTGPGIPLTERDRIFDPFYRTLGSDQPGSGLGLSIVQTIAARVGAEIVLDVADRKHQTGLDIAVCFRHCPPNAAGKPLAQGPAR